VAVRVLGQLLYIVAAWSDPEKRAAVLSFGMVSVGGMSAVIAGAWIGGNAIYWLWILGSIIDMVAAALGGRSEGWKLDRHHFSERHGLFVIIALGETLIVAGHGLTGAEWEAPLVGAALLAVAATFGFWWSYFPYAKPRIDRALHHLQQKRLTVICRDVFTLLHLPMMCGLILFAAVTAQVLEHPEDPLHLASRVGLAAGLVLFVGGMAMGVWRATGELSLARLVATLVAAALVLALDHASPLISLGLVALGAWVAATVEVKAHPWLRPQAAGPQDHHPLERGE
jgi:low temperature requirement protein LtrA